MDMMKGQVTLFDMMTTESIEKKRTVREIEDAIFSGKMVTKEEAEIYFKHREQFVQFYFNMSATKCCGFPPKTEIVERGFQSLCKFRCIICGRETEPVEDCGWVRTKELWNAMFEKKYCVASQHNCNKEELWKVADSLDETQCPHTCCRKCSNNDCGARCNGAPVVKKPRFDFTEEELHKIFCQSCDSQCSEMGGCLKYENFGGTHCSRIENKYSPWHELEPENGARDLPVPDAEWLVLEVLHFYPHYQEWVLDRVRYRDRTFIGLERSPHPDDNGNIKFWRYALADELDETKGWLHWKREEKK